MLSRSLSNPPESSCYTVRLDFWLGGFPPRRKSAFVEGSGSPEPESSSMSSGKTGAPFRHGIASSERGRIDDGRIYDFWCSPGGCLGLVSASGGSGPIFQLPVPWLGGFLCLGSFGCGVSFCCVFSRMPCKGHLWRCLWRPC